MSTLPMDNSYGNAFAKAKPKKQDNMLGDGLKGGINALAFGLNPDRYMKGQQQRAQYDQMQSQTKAMEAQQSQNAERQYAEVMYRFGQKAKSLPVDQRRMFAEQFAQRYPQLAPAVQQGLQDPNALTDQDLDSDLMMLEAKYGFAAPAPPENEVINNHLVNPITGEVIGDYRDPMKVGQTDRVLSSDGTRQLQGQDLGYVERQNRDLGIKQQNADTAQFKAQNPSPMVTVNTGDAGAGQRPIVDKPPKGFQRIFDPATGSYRDEPIPGSEAFQDREGGQVKKFAALNAAEEQHRVMTASIDRALEQVGSFTAGLGSATSAVPGTPGKDLEQTLATVKALIGFDALQQMRENSPTGGALGQVTEKELAFLQAVQGSLDQAQSPQQLRDTLVSVRESLARLQAARRQYFQDDASVRDGNSPSITNQAITEMSDSDLLRDLGIK